MKKLSLIASGFLLLACLTSVSHATTVTLAEFTKANANNTCSTTQDLTIKFKPHESMGEYQVTIPVKLKPLASDRFKRTANIVVRKIGASPQVLKIIADTPNSVENDPCFVRIEDFNFEAPKTKDFVAMTKNLKVSDKKLLVILPEANKNVYLSARNIEGANVQTISGLNTYRVLNAGVVVLTENSLKAIDNILI